MEDTTPEQETPSMGGMPEPMGQQDIQRKEMPQKPEAKKFGWITWVIIAIIIIIIILLFI